MAIRFFTSVLPLFFFASLGTCEEESVPPATRAGFECDFWANNGECGENLEFMQENCKASCDAMASRVARMGSECDFWKNNGECDSNSEYMQEFCKASCQLGTTPDGSPYGEECDFWANNGECDTNYEYMQEFCKASCEHLRNLEDVRAGSECDYWADNGECDTNPDFMREFCKASCEETEIKMIQDIGHIQSFYDLSAVDIDGKFINFEIFRGKVTIVANVASYCGFTESHYRELVALHKDLAHTKKVEILGFPCNQFGEQEPDSPEEIKAFVQKKGVNFRMMDKIEVNGLYAHPVYKYLKMKTSLPKIEWNFATYFVISPDGKVHPFSGIVPSQLKDVVLGLLEKEL